MKGLTAEGKKHHYINITVDKKKMLLDSESYYIYESILDILRDTPYIHLEDLD